MKVGRIEDFSPASTNRHHLIFIGILVVTFFAIERGKQLFKFLFVGKIYLTAVEFKLILAVELFKVYKNLPLNLRDNTLTGMKNFFLLFTHFPMEDNPPPGTITFGMRRIEVEFI